MEDALPQLAAQLRNGNLVAFVGAGASATFRDPDSGREWPGLPTAGDMVAEMAKVRSYVQSTHDFGQACFVLKLRESRGQLEEFILGQIDRPNVKPLPAHTLLANLPFSAYLTTNYDPLIEAALREARRAFHPIIEDVDVARLKPSELPVVKVNGCVTRPKSIVASEDEFLPIGERAPIMEALIKTELANKTVLFVGFSLGDPHFAALYQSLRRSLGGYVPRSIAIVGEADEYRRNYWQAMGVTILEADLTQTLRELARAAHATPSAGAVSLPGEDWINNEFFVALGQIGSLPSETQVIDAYLDHLLEEVHGPAFDLVDITVRARQALAMILEYRPNYEAMARLTSDLLDRIDNDCSSKDDAELLVRALIDDRLSLSRHFKNLARDVVDANDSLLVFSQSLRVLQLLDGVPRGVQQTCQIFVAECRPKSPRAFQDAIGICEHLQSSDFDITIVPDAAIGNLLQRRQISKVLMGAHAVHMVDGEPIQFVNTCGSAMICSVASQLEVPVYLIAEEAKLATFASRSEIADISYKEEEQLFSGVTPSLADLQASGQGIRTLNIGYDLCSFSELTRLVTENGYWATHEQVA